MKRSMTKILSTITVTCLSLCIIGAMTKEATSANNSVTIKLANAGVCSALSVNLKKEESGVCSAVSQNLQVAKCSVKEKVTKTSTASKVEALVDTKYISKNKDGKITVCGYENLGIVRVEDGNLNIRKTPAKDGKILGKITNNAGCEVLKEKDGWVKIKSGKVKGWVSNEYLVTGETALKKVNKAVMHVAKVKTDNLRVRSKASTDARVITKVAKGEKLEVVKVVDDWIKVEINGGEGYISEEYADVSYALDEAATLKELSSGKGGVSDTRTSLVQYALQFVGGRYVWGGTRLGHGVDCSGFTMGVFARYGIYLPHHSGSQAGCGTRISASEARPGDLFFYSHGGRIGHVALYIGNGQIVHAQSARTGIVISNAFYSSPACVVRVLP